LPRGEDESRGDVDVVDSEFSVKAESGCCRRMAKKREEFGLVG
jgi:hypothetical protein